MSVPGAPQPALGIPMPLAEATALAHAVTQRMLADHGIRALFVKGPVAALQGLRPPKTSLDADILCDPAAMDGARILFERHGWVRYYGDRSDALAIGAHAQAYVRDGWPCSVDLHAHFPGFLAPPEVVFTHLWGRRSVIDVAHQPITVPDPADHLVLLGVHGLRGLPLDAPLPSAQLRSGWEGLGDDGRAAAVATARHTGALEPLRELLVELGADPGPVQEEYAPEYARWHGLRARPGDAATVWAGRWQAASWRQRPALAWRAVWDVSVDRDRTPQEWAQAGPRARMAGRVRRARKGIRQGWAHVRPRPTPPP